MLEALRYLPRQNKEIKAAIYFGPGDTRIEEIATLYAGPLIAVVKIEAVGLCEIIYGTAWQKGGFQANEIGKARGTLGPRVPRWLEAAEYI